MYCTLIGGFQQIILRFLHLFARQTRKSKQTGQGLQNSNMAAADWKYGIKFGTASDKRKIPYVKRTFSRTPAQWNYDRRRATYLNTDNR